MDLGRFRQARSLVWQNRWRYAEHGGRIEQVKLKWLLGLVEAGLGNLDGAELGLWEARQELDDLGLRYHASLAGLDLASVLLRRNQHMEARAVVLEASDVFLDLGIQREAMGAVLLLREVFKSGVEARAILDQAILFLRRQENDPTLSFSAWFV